MIEILNHLLNQAYCVDYQKSEDTVGATAKEQKVVLEKNVCRSTQDKDQEIEILKSALGELHTDEKIEIYLHDLLKILPRTRRKADAYKGLKSKLKKEYGVELVITTKKNV